MKGSALKDLLVKINDVYRQGSAQSGTRFIEQVSFLIYLKLLDEREAALRKGETHFLTLSCGDALLFDGFAEDLLWHKWSDRPSGELVPEWVASEVIDYVQSFTHEAPEVAHFFQDADIDLVPDSFEQMYSILDEIYFNEVAARDRGDFYEGLFLSILTSRKGMQYQTPIHLRRTMVEMLDPSEGESVFDPACGTGGLLADAYEHVCALATDSPESAAVDGVDWVLQELYEGNIEAAKKDLPSWFTHGRPPRDLSVDEDLSLYGVDISRLMTRIASLRLKLLGASESRILRANSLSERGGQLTKSDLSRKYDAVITNPPFGGRQESNSVRETLKDGNSVGRRQELLFVKLAMHSLKPGGRCAIVVPAGVLFGSTTYHQRLRRSLVKDFKLDAIIALDSSIYAYRSIDARILLFRNPEEHQATSGYPIWFFEVQKDGYSWRDRSKPTPAENDLPLLLEEWEAYRKSDFQKPPGVYTADVVEHSEPLKSWWINSSDIDEETYELSPSRYRPRRRQKEVCAPEEILESLSRLESRIGSNVEKLQRHLRNE